MIGLRGYFLGGLAIVVFLAWSALSAIVTKNTELAGQVVTLQHTIDLNAGREASFRRMIDRRDAAIDAAPGTCKTMIRNWITHPDDVPKPFNPFQQLGGN